jgi:hypothetical protein
MIVAMGSCAGADDSHPRDEAARGETGETGVTGGNGEAGESAGDSKADETGEDGEELVREVLAATREAESGRVEVATTLLGVGSLPGAPPGVESLRVVHTAAFDNRAGRAEAQTDLSELAAVLGDAASTSADLTSPTRMVADGEVVYSQLGPMAEEYGLAPTDWVQIDRPTFVEGRPDSETAALLLDPLGPLDLLRLPVREVRTGEPTDDLAHLVVVLDLAGAPGPGATPEPGGIEERLAAHGVDELEVELWIDGSRRARRLEFRLDGAVAGPAAPAGLVTTFELSSIGERLDMALPDPADVLDPAAVRGRSNGG